MTCKQLLFSIATLYAFTLFGQYVELNHKKAMIQYRLKSISQLFDIGGTATGSWCMGGMPWPLEELKRRTPVKVKAEAMRRLTNKAIRMYDQVFAVYCLILLFKDDNDVDKFLQKVYPNLGPQAKYEILLYASENRITSYKNFFIQVLNEKSSSLTKSQLLAVSYFGQLPDKAVIKRIKKLEQKNMSSDYFLDGFPYSDVVLHSVYNPRKFIQNTIGIIEEHERNKKMTDEEKRLLNKARELILKPFRASIAFSDLTETQVVSKLNSTYPLYNIDERESCKIKNMSLDMKKASLHEVLAELCNSNSFAVGEDVNGLSLYSSTINKYCDAKGGVIANISFMKGWEQNPSPNVFLHMILGTNWLNFENAKISRIRITFPDGSIMKTEDNSFFSIPVTKQQFQAKGGMIKEISAILHVPVPKAVRRIHIPFKIDGKYEKKNGFRRVLELASKKQDNGKYEIVVKTKMSFDPIFSSHHSMCVYDKGSVLMFDDKGRQLSGKYMSFSDLKAEYSMRDVPKPAMFVWTVVTDFEFIKIPIVFKNIKLPADIWK